ncbi:MAG: DUF4878 domain-containing protein [Actinobacteria bacterium]|nr:DUF4878 domain-containing protein [Actinomycetota bacterium]
MKRAVILLSVISLAALCLAFTGCGGGGESSDTPVQVVEKFMAAAMEGNSDAAYDLISEDSKAEIGDAENLVAGFSASVAGYEVGEATISGDRASVLLNYKLQGFEGGIEFNMILVKEGGAWKISLSETEKELEQIMQQYYGEE